jgi:methylthioribose-1-phosphate isomerase
MTQPVCAVWWGPGGSLRIVDQRRLPAAFVERDLASIEAVADAIRTLAVRGAPAIGVAAAMGLAVSAEAHARGGGADVARCMDRLRADAALLRATRPTAVNLAWALDRMLAHAAGSLEGAADAAAFAAGLRAEAERIRAEDEAMCRAIGEHGASLIEDGMRVLTHCNAGALATAGIGTALAPVYAAHGRGVRVEVIAGETRPLLQGARLTAWELVRAGIPVTLCTDGMAAGLMAEGRVDLVLVGADRIAANGDVANKIGTYGLAVLAHHHRIPFVVAAPWSTVDLATPDGTGIVIEQRAPEEVTACAGVLVAPAGIAVHNPAFDVTPAAMVQWIVTDRGLHHGPRIAEVTSVELPPPA